MNAAQHAIPRTAKHAPRSLRAALPVFYRHGSPRVITGLVIACGTARSWFGGFGPWDVVVVLAVLAYWPFQEWLIHVFILHSRPLRIRGRTIDFQVPRLHREHHRDPWRAELVFIPVRAFLYSPVVTIGIFLLLVPSFAVAMTGATAFFLLTLHYEWVHFLIHTPYAPRTRYYQRLWRNHRLHHFKNEHHWFGVTMLAGDRVLRTSPRAKEVPTSASCRSLAPDPLEVE